MVSFGTVIMSFGTVVIRLSYVSRSGSYSDALPAIRSRPACTGARMVELGFFLVGVLCSDFRHSLHSLDELPNHIALFTPVKVHVTSGNLA